MVLLSNILIRCILRSGAPPAWPPLNGVHARTTWLLTSKLPELWSPAPPVEQSGEDVDRRLDLGRGAPLVDDVALVRVARPEDDGGRGPAAVVRQQLCQDR